MRTVQRLPEPEIARLAAEPFTYPDVGATASTYPSGLPAGFHHLRMRTVIGHGADHFAQASAKLMGWRMHLDTGLQVAAQSPEVAVGEVVVCRLGPGRLSLRIPCRVVYVVDEPFRHGFGYGTLPGHPESGEESFLVEMDDDVVTFTVTSFTRPGILLSRLGWPVARWMAGTTVYRYGAVLRRP